MSADALPISPAQFATALETLPLGNLYAKALELRNSLLHLQRSNEELRVFSQEAGGDRDCEEAIMENEEVMDRMRERIGIIRDEVEKRGASWHELEQASSMNMDEAAQANGHQNEDVVNDREEPSGRTNGAEVVPQPQLGTVNRSGGRLTDEQLRGQLRAQLGDEDEEDEDGVHL
ncbi:hypothetical protein UCRPC4_g05426 [Phaeomoniella chlamydospora]|uniref:Secondary alcohol dehydrogenase n=1 Tax=Phaeomoniella chlamydospora TaxID=158046 RepID=A0A0G2G1J3_PHACM|nr:hypothetical protein UCRPC4_g05426 [Phaeomoniella chlamydospora]